MPTTTSRLTVLVLALLFAMCATVLGGFAPALAPEPDPVTRRWQLEVEPGPLRMARVDVPGVGPRLYYFFTYKVTNTTNTDLLFAPSFYMANNDGDLIRSGRDVPTSVTRELLSRLGNPLLVDQIGILGTLLQGEENAKEGLVVWPAVDLDASEISIFGAGFSGETKFVEKRDSATGKTARITVRKTLMLRYEMAGDASARIGEEFTHAERRWVMR